MKNILFATAILAFSAAFAHAETIRLGTEGAYPPFNMIDDSGKVAGFEREVGDELCKRVGVTCEWVVTDWDGIIPNLQSGNYDAIMAAMSVTPERQKVMDMSEIYYPPTQSIYAAKSKDADYKTGVVSAQSGTIQSGYVAETGAKMLEFATFDEALAAMQNGEADAVFADKDYLKPHIEQSSGTVVMVGEPVALGGGIGIAFRQSDDELREKFNGAIKSMKADGSLNALLAKYFNADKKF